MYHALRTYVNCENVIHCEYHWPCLYSYNTCCRGHSRVGYSLSLSLYYILLMQVFPEWLSCRDCSNTPCSDFGITTRVPQRRHPFSVESSFWHWIYDWKSFGTSFIHPLFTQSTTLLKVGSHLVADLMSWNLSGTACIWPTLLCHWLVVIDPKVMEVLTTRQHCCAPLLIYN